MSRIQDVLDKAEREGAALRTSRLGPGTTAVPLTIAIPPPRPPHTDYASGTGAVSVGPPFTATVPQVAAPPAQPADSATVENVYALLDPLLVAGLAPKSPAAEQFRALRTRIAHAEGASALRTLLVTSPQKGEGKSLTSANLALTMAQELQRRVVLVEADLRKPSLQQMFNLPDGPGLAEYLSGGATLSSAMRFLPEYNLTIIPAGSPPANPAELLGSSAMRRLLDQLRNSYDRIILDTPPVVPLADVAVLAPLVDRALLVVRAGVTPKPAIENALRAFDSSKLLGIVLNESGVENDYRYEETA